MKKEGWILAGATLAVLIYNRAAIANTYNGTLSIRQLLDFVQGAGFEDASHTIIAVSIALAESSGNPNAKGDIDIPEAGSASYGLWQINSFYHPEFGPNFDELFNPVANAAAAYSVYVDAGYSFTPWTTYKSGAYEKYLESVTEVFQSVGL